MCQASGSSKQELQRMQRYKEIRRVLFFTICLDGLRRYKKNFSHFSQTTEVKPELTPLISNKCNASIDTGDSVRIAWDL
jgi:hypothetical protein